MGEVGYGTPGESPSICMQQCDDRIPPEGEKRRYYARTDTDNFLSMTIIYSSLLSVLMTTTDRRTDDVGRRRGMECVWQDSKISLLSQSSLIPRAGMPWWCCVLLCGFMTTKLYLPTPMGTFILQSAGGLRCAVKLCTVLWDGFRFCNDCDIRKIVFITVHGGIDGIHLDVYFHGRL